MENLIKSIRWTGKNQREMFDFLTDSTGKEITLEEDTFRIDLVNGGCQVGNLIIKTLEGEAKANIGDYVIKESRKNFYPCRPIHNENDYKKAED